MKNKFLLILLLLTSIFTTINAQVNLDPQHEIYEDLYTWENRGYIQNLPSFKPYPLDYLKKLLNQVINNGLEKDIIKAEKYLLECESGVSGVVESFTSVTSDQSSEIGSILLEGQGAITDNISIALKGGTYITFDEDELSTLPTYTRRGLDYNTDTSNVGPFELMSTWSSNLTVGNENLWFTAGIGKASYGPFTGDNIIYSADAPDAIYYSLNAIIGNVTYNKSLFQLSATDLQGEGEYSGKFLSTGGVTWQALPWLNLGIFDSVTFGDTFDVSYLLPFSQLMYTQGFNGFDDNVMIGVTGEIEFPNDINLKGAVLIDDFAFNDAIQLNFDSKYKFAMESYLDWAPKDAGILEQIEIGYKMVSPYMYTHEPYSSTIDGEDTIEFDYTETDAVNYLNYTNSGESIGSEMLPNTDRFSFTSKFTLPFDIDLSFFVFFYRHANASDDIPDSYEGIDIVWYDDDSYFLDVDGDGTLSTYYVTEDDEILTEEDVTITVTTDLGTSEESTTTIIDDSLYDYSAEESLYIADGSLNDFGLVIKNRWDVQDHWIYLWLDSFPFLTQADIDYIFQTGFGLSKEWKLDFTDISTDLDYTFQIYNDEIDNFLDLSITFKF